MFLLDLLPDNRLFDDPHVLQPPSGPRHASTGPVSDGNRPHVATSQQRPTSSRPFAVTVPDRPFRVAEAIVTNNVPRQANRAVDDPASWHIRGTVSPHDGFPYRRIIAPGLVADEYSALP